MSDPHDLAAWLNRLADHAEFDGVPIVRQRYKAAADLLELLDDCLRTHHEEEPVLPCPICAVVKGHHRDDE